MQNLPTTLESLQLKKSSPVRRSRDNITIILFLLPALTLFLIFVIYPILQSIYYSFFNWNGLGPANNFIGLQNFLSILSDTVFLTALKNVVLLVVLSLVIQLPIAMLLAVLVGRNLPGQAFFRTIFFLPFVLSEVITAIMWLLILNPDPSRGFINAILVLIGIQPQDWLANTNIVLVSIFVALTWKYFGFHMLLYLAGLQNIPMEVEEAATMDGANAYQKFFNIILPLLNGTIRTSVYLSILGSLQQFILVWIMTQGGPVNASETLATYMYRYGFVRFQLGYGSAVALYMFLLCLIFSIIYYYYFLRLPDNLSGV